MLLTTVVHLLCLASLADAFLVTRASWDGLKVTWGMDVHNPNTFARLPRQENEAKEDGWTKIADCDSSSKFRGVRYVKHNDYSVILLFDSNGYIAGIQCGVDKLNLTANYPPVTQLSAFQEDGDRRTLTAYFTDPATICTTGRSSVEWDAEGTGNGLYIQNGTDPVSHSIRIPLSESALATTGWTKGRCFAYMGMHYWYNITADMSCEFFFPAFLLYNKGALTAFGWATGLGLTSSRFEHPPHAAFSAFLNPVPLCLSQYAQLSTMHIYLTADPTADMC